MCRRLLLCLALLARRLDGVPVQNPPQRQVEGVVGETALLQPLIPPGKAMTQMEWDFQPESSPAIVIAEFTKGSFERPNPDDQFQQRLERADNTTLRIRDLGKEDSGVYTAHVRFEGAEVQEQEFLLMVSDKSRHFHRWSFRSLLTFVVVLVLILILLLKNRVKQLFRKINLHFKHLRRLRTPSAEESNTPHSPSGTEPGEGLTRGVLTANSIPCREETV